MICCTMGVSNTKLAKNASNDFNWLSCFDARSWCNTRCTDERHHLSNFGELPSLGYAYGTPNAERLKAGLLYS